MNLFTSQDINFDIMQEASSLKKSEWYNCANDIPTNNIKLAYDYLFKRLKVANLIWCWGDIGNCMLNYEYNKEPYRIWCLNVPDKYITTIDSEIWDYTLNQWYYFQDELYEQHVFACKNEQEVDRAIVKVEKIFKHPSNTYGKLIKPLKNASLRDDQFLIPTPLQKRWVINTFIVTPHSKKDILKKGILK